jgi:uncharacterized protein YndB with AHSA1/START domain
VAVDVTCEATIRRPRGEVAAYAADPDNTTSWYANIKAVEWETPRPLSVGSRLKFVATFLGRRLAYTYEIRELVPGERLVMSTEQGPFPMETTYMWQDAGEGATRMTLRNRRRARRLREGHRPGHGPRDAAGDEQGPAAPRGDPAAVLTTGARAGCAQHGRRRGRTIAPLPGGRDARLESDERGGA